MERLVRCSKCGKVASIKDFMFEEYREGEEYKVRCSCEDCGNEFTLVFDMVHYCTDNDNTKSRTFNSDFDYLKEKIANLIDCLGYSIEGASPNMREWLADYFGEDDSNIEKALEQYGAEYLGLIAMVYYYNSDTVEDILRGYY